MKSTRIISLVLLAAMLTGTIACGEAKPSSDDTTAAGTDSETLPAVTGRDAVSDGLPEKDFGGATFTILDRTKYSYEFGVTEENGDLLNDAVFRRNQTVEDRFNADITTYTIPCSWGAESDAFNATLRSSIMAGDGAFDLVAGYAATIPALVSDGLFYDWNKLDYVDFSKPWWSELVAEELTINGKMFLATGDLSLALWQGMNCIYFNKVLGESYNIGDMYQTVLDGKWTLDKLIELSKDIYRDLDGDTKQSDDDFYGLLCGYETEIDNMKEAFEIHVTTKGSDGFPEITLVNEHTIAVVQKLNSFIHENDGVFFTSSEPRLKCQNAFSDGRGVFYTATLGKSEQLRAMDDDFGILPYPKYDESQESYHSTSLDEFSLFVIPTDVKDPEMTAILTEALCAESYKQVVPVFYDTALKTKAARDEDSSAMIDIIRDSLTFDFGYLHSSSIDSVGHMFVGWIRENNNNIVSSYDARSSGFATKLEKVLSVYKD